VDTETWLKLVISAVGAIVALAALIRACLEFVQQGRQRRAQMFFDLRRRLKEPELARVAELIDLVRLRDDTSIAELELQLERTPLRIKRDYIGLFEEVSLMMRWGLVSPSTANYMFGYYAILCDETPSFWAGDINKESLYWEWFRDFCRRMQSEDEKLRQIELSRQWPDRSRRAAKRRARRG